MNISKMILKAKEASKKARIHLSHFPVGCCIMSNTGKTYSGCNIEFDNYSNTIHAEECAIVQMILGGDKIPSIVVVYTKSKDLDFPCGSCRQSLFELGGYDIKVISCNDVSAKEMTMRELLPLGFKLNKE